MSPTGKDVDAAVLLARMLVPEPMRPGWPDRLQLTRSALPADRLMALDDRMRHAAAKPVIFPETVVVDHGAIYLSATFKRACRTLGISLQPARPYTPTDKSVVERSFSSINTLFCQPRRWLPRPARRGPRTHRRHRRGAHPGPTPRGLRRVGGQCLAEPPA